MRKQLLLALVLLNPVLASAQTPYDTYDSSTHGWLGIGLGSGSITSTAPAPSAGHDAFGGSIDAGYRFGPEWGLGIEFGVVGARGGCGGNSCTPARPDFAPDFTRWFLISEYRPNDGGLRLRAGVGVSSMCYRHYKGRRSGWDGFLNVLLFNNTDTTDTIWKCKSLSALGASASIGYQWSMPGSRGTVGLQLHGEAANFAASSNAGTSSFRHQAWLVQVQFNLE